MDHIETLLKLPFETLALMSAGYLSYRLAYTGKDGTHSTVDVVFMTFVFAFVAKLATTMLAIAVKALELPPRPIIHVLLGLAAAIIVAAIWRRFGEAAVFQSLRSLKISASDRHETVWHTQLARPTKLGPAQLFVRCEDGTRLLCSRLADFNHAPHGPCLFGQDGSVGMYVTDRKVSDTAEWECDQKAGCCDPQWGYEFTFIPAGRIAEVRINYPFSPSV